MAELRALIRELGQDDSQIGELHAEFADLRSNLQAAVRPGEPIYIGEKVLNELPQRLGCQVVNVTTSGMRYYVILEK